MSEDSPVWVTVLIVLLAAGAIVAACIIPAIIFCTGHYEALISNTILTQEQVEKLFVGDPTNRVWGLSCENVTIDGRPYIKVTFATRQREFGRIGKFLDSLGVDYVLKPSNVDR